MGIHGLTTLLNYKKCPMIFYSIADFLAHMKGITGNNNGSIIKLAIDENIPFKFLIESKKTGENLGLLC